MPPNLTFLQRFEAISKLQAAFVLTEPSASHAQTKATALEQLAFDSSHDLTDYQSRLDAVISDSSKTDVPHTETHVQDSLTLPTGGVTIGRYVNAVHHADGLFSDVYKAMPREDHDLILPNKSIVALKLTNPSAMEPPHDSIREVRLLQRARHPFVVELLDHFHQAGGRLILVFPFLPYTLEDQLKRGNMQLPHQKLLLSQLMQGLEHIHSCGIIHRDIKPSNILLASPTGPAYIADFGIAWAADDPSAEPENEKIMDVGTTSYRPPELMFGNQWYNSSIDMWATGCVVAQVVSLGSQTLFDSGDLGSDLALIKSIFSTLGTPNMDTWPEAKSLPDWGKMAFQQYPSKPWSVILPGASADAIELVRQLVVYESGDRMEAKTWRKQSFFNQDM